MQFDSTVRTAIVEVIEAAVGASPLLRVYNGTKPATCADADTGTLLAEGTLPVDWMAAAADGVKNLAGSWLVYGLPAAGVGTDGTYFRLFDASGTTCRAQGTFGEGAEEMVADDATMVDGQEAEVVLFRLTAGNA